MENMSLCVLIYIVLNAILFIIAEFVTNLSVSRKDGDYSIKWGQLGYTIRILMTAFAGILFPIVMVYHNLQFVIWQYILLLVIISSIHVALYKISRDRHSFTFLSLFLIVSLMTMVSYIGE